MKKRSFILILIALCFCLSANDRNRTGTGAVTADTVTVEIGNSEKFNKEEIEAAVDCVKMRFHFDDCELLRICYDEERSDTIIGHGRHDGLLNENVIVLLVDFKVALKHIGSFTPGEIYPESHWVLIRDCEDDPWRIDGSGY